MPQTRTVREERIEARLTKRQKNLIESAARSRGVSVSQFLIESAGEAARLVLAHESVIRPTLDEGLRFAEAILNPPPMKPKLRATVDRYRRLYRSSVVVDLKY